MNRPTVLAPTQNCLLLRLKTLTRERERERDLDVVPRAFGTPVFSLATAGLGGLEALSAVIIRGSFAFPEQERIIYFIARDARDEKAHSLALETAVKIEVGCKLSSFRGAR